MNIQSKTIALIGLASVVVGLGCKPKQPTNQDLLAEYSGEKYQQDMVATDYEKVESQGSGIDPRTQAAIEDTITSVYVSDFEKCLESEMSRLDNRWVAGDFALEFTIEPSGMVSNVKMLSADVKERRTKDAKGKYVTEGGEPARDADQFGQCVEQKVYKWEFDPPPETTYTHTYNGRVGEAW